MTRGLVDPAAVRRVSRTMALRKVAQPEDVAAQVVVLASDTLSGHVTGQVVTVAGGMEGRVVHEGLSGWTRRAAKPDRPAARAHLGPQDDCRQSPTRSRTGIGSLRRRLEGWCRAAGAASKKARSRDSQDPDAADTQTISSNAAVRQNAAVGDTGSCMGTRAERGPGGGPLSLFRARLERPRPGR